MQHPHRFRISTTGIVTMVINNGCTTWQGGWNVPLGAEGAYVAVTTDKQVGL